MMFFAVAFLACGQIAPAGQQGRSSATSPQRQLAAKIAACRDHSSVQRLLAGLFQDDGSAKATLRAVAADPAHEADVALVIVLDDEFADRRCNAAMLELAATEKSFVRRRADAVTAWPMSSDDHDTVYVWLTMHHLKRLADLEGKGELAIQEDFREGLAGRIGEDYMRLNVAVAGELIGIDVDPARLDRVRAVKEAGRVWRKWKASQDRLVFDVSKRRFREGSPEEVAASRLSQRKRILRKAGGLFAALADPESTAIPGSDIVVTPIRDARLVRFWPPPPPNKEPARVP